MAQTSAGCMEGHRPILWRAIGGAWLVGAVVLAPVGHLAATEQARQSDLGPRPRLPAGLAPTGSCWRQETLAGSRSLDPTGHRPPIGRTALPTLPQPTPTSPESP